MVAKSGWPVMGQTQVNSGQSIEISKGRPGFGLGNVCSSRDGLVGMACSDFRVRGRVQVQGGCCRLFALVAERTTGRSPGNAPRPCNPVPAWKASRLLQGRQRPSEGAMNRQTRKADRARKRVTTTVGDI